MPKVVGNLTVENGNVAFTDYGQNNITGTPATNAVFDTNGNIIEAPLSVGSSTFALVTARISVQADGTVNGSDGISVTKGSTGIYNYTFDTPQPNANYAVSGVMTMGVGWTDTNINVRNKTTTGFTVDIGQGDNGTTADTLVDQPHDLIIVGDTLGDEVTATWGTIQGTLSNQTDLQNALNDKADNVHTHVASEITDFDTEVSNNSSVVANTAKVSFPGFSTLLADYGFTDNSTNWNTAFSWGDHALAGYLTSFTETDPIFTASQASNITATDITNLSNLSGVNTGDQTSIVGITGTKAQFDTALTDGDFLYVGDVTSFPGFGTLTSDYGITLATVATTGDYSDLIGTPSIPSSLVNLTDVVSATNTNRFALMANGTTGYVGRALVEADISDLQAYLLSVNISDINATGTADATTYLRGDGTWATVSGGGGLNNIVEDTSPQLGGNLDAQNFDITGVDSITSRAALFGTGVSNLRAFNIYGTGLDGRLSLQGGPGDNPGLEMTTSANAQRVLLRLQERGADGTSLECYIEPIGGGISRAWTTDEDSTFWMFPSNAGTSPTNNAGIRNNAGVMQFKDAAGTWTNILQAGGGSTDYISGGSFNSTTGDLLLTGVGLAGATISLDGRYLTSELNDLTQAVTWANVPDANITQSSVTQHQGALSITESQISDLQSYVTSVNLSSVPLTNLVNITNSAGGNATISSFSTALAGVVPASGGGTTNFLRADGTWAAPSGGGSGGYSMIWAEMNNDLNPSENGGLQWSFGNGATNGQGVVVGFDCTGIELSATFQAAPTGTVRIALVKNGVDTVHEITGNTTEQRVTISESFVAGDTITFRTISGAGGTVCTIGLALLTGSVPDQLINDTTPQLGGDLDLNGFDIIGLNVDLSLATSTNLLRIDNTAGNGVLLEPYTTAAAGLVPATEGTTNRYLRSDGGWTILPTQSKSISIKDPQVEEITLFATNEAITITKIVLSRKGTGTVSVDFAHGTDSTSTNNTILATQNVTASTLTSVTTGFTDNTIPINSFVNMDITAVGSATEFNVTIFYRPD